MFSHLVVITEAIARLLRDIEQFKENKHENLQIVDFLSKELRRHIKKEKKDANTNKTS